MIILFLAVMTILVAPKSARVVRVGDEVYWYGEMATGDESGGVVAEKGKVAGGRRYIVRAAGIAAIVAR